MTLPLRLLRSGLLMASLGLLVCGETACPGQQTINKLTQHVTIPQVLPGGVFSGYTDTTFGESLPKGKQVHLLSATMASSSGEFSWAASLVGSASPNPDSEMVVEKTSFSGATNPTDLDIVDKGDLTALFPDTQNFKVYWELAFAGQPAQSYPNGVEVTFTYEVEIK